MTIKTAELIMGWHKELNENPHTTESSEKNPIFAVRVQLSNADLYEDLHDVMEKHGFYRTLLDSNGKVKALPTAMYSYIAKTEFLTCNTVFGYAKDAVKEHLDSTRQQEVGVELFVSNLTGAWFDLNDAKQSDDR